VSDISNATDHSSSTSSSSPPISTEKRPLRILAVDGGGIHGIIPLVVLKELEICVREAHGKALHEVFDFFAGTSTGGMIVSALCAKSSDGSVNPSTAKDVLDDYVNHGAEIFPWKLENKILTLWGWGARKFDHEPLERMIKKRVGNARLKDTTVELLLTSYDLHSSRPYFFKRWRAQQYPEDRDHPLWEAVRSTAAAPTVFEPHNLVGRDGTGKEIYNRCLIDGGLIANNPSMCAWAEAQKMLQDFPPDPEGPRGHLPFDPDNLRRVLLVSLGTGSRDTELDETGVDPMKRRYQYGRARLWPKPFWAQPAISSSMDGVADTVEHELKHVLISKEEYETDNRLTQEYFRFQSGLTEVTQAMDEANDKTIPALLKLGNDLVRAERDQIERLAAMLTPI